MWSGPRADEVDGDSINNTKDAAQRQHTHEIGIVKGLKSCHRHFRAWSMIDFPKGECRFTMVCYDVRVKEE